jgi:S-DNA-T family DNA segregation ATPase FtsK/SpoIIIE
MDIAGVIMALVGLLTMLSLFSVRNGSLTGYWISALKSVFGWGVYILPIGLIVLGAWLVARNVERLPALSLERIVGILLLFAALLAAFHGLSGSAASALERARAGEGGGYIGALLQQGLVSGLGDAGAAILVVGWMLIALAMTLDLSLSEMFRWTGPLAAGLKNRLGRLRQTGSKQPGGSGPSGPDGRTPVPRFRSGRVG